MRLLLISFIILYSSLAFAMPKVNTDGSYAVSAMAASGENIAISYHDGKIRVINPSTSKVLLTLQGHSKPIATISADSQGKYILSAGQDGKVILWDAKTGKIVNQALKLGNSFRASAMDAKGKYAVAGFASTIYMWDTKTWENIALLDRVDGDVYSLAITDDGKTIIAGGKNGKISIYDIESGKLKTQLQAGNSIVTSVAVAPNSKTLFSAGYDKLIRSWDLESGKLIKEYSRHNDTIRSISVANGGKKFASSSDDGAVFLWDAAKGTAEVLISENNIPAVAVVLDPNLRYIAAGTGGVSDNSKSATIFFPKDKRQTRTIYAFSDAVVAISSIGYVDGSGSFANYINIYEGGRRYKFSDVAQKYHRPERMVIDLR